MTTEQQEKLAKRVARLERKIEKLTIIIRGLTLLVERIDKTVL